MVVAAFAVGAMTVVVIMVVPVILGLGTRLGAHIARNKVVKPRGNLLLLGHKADTNPAHTAHLGADADIGGSGPGGFAGRLSECRPSGIDGAILGVAPSASALVRRGGRVGTTGLSKLSRESSQEEGRVCGQSAVAEVRLPRYTGKVVHLSKS